jgi:2,7-dihydroxy-5-methyl-1-naphthoate 7-O-methyltransferase
VVSAATGDGGVDLWALLDLETPWALRVVATLGIPDLVAGGTHEVGALAAACGADAAVLHAVLDHVAGRGVFVQTAPGVFAANAASTALGEAAPSLDLDGIGGRLADAMGTLLGYVRTGRPGYAERFGRPFWDDLAAHPEVAASFDALMGEGGHTFSADLPLPGGWDGVGWVVDVGGGTGAMLARLLVAHPGVRGTLLDLAPTVARSAPVFAAAGVVDRVDVVGRSFFDPLPAGADVYLLRKVLEDWPDDETTAILRRCAEAARPGGRVVVAGGVAARGEPPHLAIEQVLLGGRADPLDTFTERAAGAGLAVTGTVEADGKLVVELRPT